MSLLQCLRYNYDQPRPELQQVTTSSTTQSSPTPSGPGILSSRQCIHLLAILDEALSMVDDDEDMFQNHENDEDDEVTQ